MGIPGEDLPGSWAATEFVAWYNGHPDYRDLEFDLSAERAVVVGNGNVAADVARMLALTRDELAETDVADHALDVLAESNVTEIVVLGRRGPAQAAFTNPELLELGDMTDADVFVDPGDVELDPLSKAFIESEAAHTTAKKNVDILGGYATREPLGQAAPDRAALPRLAGGDPRRRARGGHPHRPQRAGRGRAGGGQGARHRRYGGARLRPRVPLDRLPRHADRGRALRRGALRDPERPRPHSRRRRSRRIRRRAGSSADPPGIIGTNKRDAQETVDVLLEDLDGGKLPAPSDPDRDSLDALLAERQPEAVSYAGWQAVDRAEREAGEPHGRPRVKLCSFDELLEAAKAATPAP